MENYGLKNVKIFERLFKNRKRYQIWRYSCQKKFHQHQEPISIKNIDINKILVSTNVSFGKKVIKYFIDYKDAKKSDLYTCFYQK